MSAVKNLIQMLSSNNPNKRYDACEELRVTRPPLPEEALDALRLATEDPNAQVADAAQRALALHVPSQEAPEARDMIDPQESTVPDRPAPLSWTRAVVYGIVGALVGTVGAVPISVAKSAMLSSGACGPLSIVSDSIWLTTCGLIFFNGTCFVFVFLGGALFGVLGMLIGQKVSRNPAGKSIQWWSFLAGMLYVLLFISLYFSQ